jgi:hypothetical protein
MPGYDHCVGSWSFRQRRLETLDLLATKASAEYGKNPKRLISSHWKHRRRYLPASQHQGQSETWTAGAFRAFGWFLGENDVQTALIDLRTGACCDGLHIDRRNENKGAESTLSYLLGLAELRKFARPAAKKNNDLEARLIRSASRSGFYQPAQMPNVRQTSVKDPAVPPVKSLSAQRDVTVGSQHASAKSRV